YKEIKMKLVRYGEAGAEKLGLVDDQGTLRDLSAVVDDIDGDWLSQGGVQRLSGIALQDLPLVEGTPRLGPCVGRIGKMVCVGLNYSDHAKEAGATPPTEPILFLKP